jgi:hypothetical protein
VQEEPSSVGDVRTAKPRLAHKCYRPNEEKARRVGDECGWLTDELGAEEAEVVPVLH